MSPGQIDTPMMPLEGEERKAMFEQSTKGNVIPRVGTAEEAAMGILFLIQNNFVTGTTVDVDGGWLISS